MYRNIRLIPAMDLSDLFVVLSVRITIWVDVSLDSFLKLALPREGADIEETYKTLETISEKYHVKFVLSISMNAADLFRVRERKCCSIFIREIQNERNRSCQCRAETGELVRSI